MFNTSINVYIAFVAGDEEVTFIDTTLVSLDQTDPKVKGFLNSGIQDSSITINATLPNDANISVPIVTVNVPVAIGGTWTSTEAERFDFNTAGGIATYTGLEKQSVVVNFDVGVTGAAANEFASHVLLNGVDATDDPPIIDIIVGNARAIATGTQIFRIDTGDTLQLAISNTINTQNPSVHQARMVISHVS